MDANVDYRSDLEHRLETLSDASLPPIKADCHDPVDDSCGGDGGGCE